MTLSPTSSRVGSGAVSSVFARTGDVVAAANDYTYAQIAAAAAAIAISNLADPTTGKVIGSSAGAAAAVFPPGYLLGSAQATANVTINSTTPGTPTTILSLGALTFDGGNWDIEVYNPALNCGSTRTLELTLSLDGTVLGKIGELNGQAAMSQSSFGLVKVPQAPSAGSHTYLVGAYMDAGVGLAQAGAGTGGAFFPITIRAVKRG